MYDYDDLMSKRLYNIMGLIVTFVVWLFGILRWGLEFSILPVVVAGILGWNLLKIQQQLEEYHEYEKSQKRQQLKNIRDQYDELCIKLGYSESNCYSDYKRLIWIHSDVLYNAEPYHEYRERYERSQDNGTDLYKKLHYTTIPVKNIQYFSKEGDIQYTSRITGGGGGGSSLSGAIIGGMIAGEAGAIIGSRKKTDEIETTTITHDQRQSVVRYFEDNSLKTLTCSGYKLYDYLSLKIPEKDLLTIQLNSIPTTTVVQKTTTSDPTPPVKESDPIKAKLQQLHDWHNSGLITDAEYAEKKRALLDSI